jgi:hypothetical protein
MRNVSRKGISFAFTGSTNYRIIILRRQSGEQDSNPENKGKSPIASKRISRFLQLSTDYYPIQVCGTQ